MQLYNRGIRRDSHPCCKGDRRRLELAYSLMMTLPGTPVIRYGDEIGMGDDLRLPRAKLRANADAMVDRASRRLHQKRQTVLPVISEGAVWFSTRKCRRPAARSEFAAELDGAHYSHAQRGS